MENRGNLEIIISVRVRLVECRRFWCKGTLDVGMHKRLSFTKTRSTELQKTSERSVARCKAFRAYRGLNLALFFSDKIDLFRTILGILTSVALGIFGLPKLGKLTTVAIKNVFRMIGLLNEMLLIKQASTTIQC